MKKVKNKYIRLTEEELKKIVREGVKQELSLINEYSIKRKQYKFNFWSLLPRIIENWCLVHYCTITNTDVNSCKRHWKVELRALMSNIASDTIKGNDSVESRLNVLMEVIDEKELLGNAIKIEDIIVDKFIQEKIAITNTEFNTVVNDCMNSLETIALAIARKEVRDYIETI